MSKQILAWLSLAFAVVVLGLFVVKHARAAQPEYKIVTASERGTYIVVGRDLCVNVAPDAGFDCDAVPSAGSTDNVFRLRFEPGVKLAIVQSDTFQSFIDRATAGNKEAGNLIGPLRVILPLYNEEIYFVARADSPLNYV
ncbi:MAG TPA: TAXI family TRAP transporter solute-binding subunit, partial [Casimicrobiaceae bacterium]|nr:TAXI family TRAP transporter solute-binding subunit [Casimicrobiaceae bacterium]